MLLVQIFRILCKLKNTEIIDENRNLRLQIDNEKLKKIEAENVSTGV